MVFLLSKSYSEEMNTWQTKNAKKHRSFPCFLQRTENSPQNYTSKRILPAELQEQNLHFQKMS